MMAARTQAARQAEARALLVRPNVRFVLLPGARVRCEAGSSEVVAAVPRLRAELAELLAGLRRAVGRANPRRGQGGFHASVDLRRPRPAAEGERVSSRVNGRLRCQNAGSKAGLVA